MPGVTKMQEVPYSRERHSCESGFAFSLAGASTSNTASVLLESGARHSLRVSGAADNLILGRQEPNKVSEFCATCRVSGSREIQ